MPLNPFTSPARIKGLFDWRKRGYSDHAPQFIKLAILEKYALDGATWVEDNGGLPVGSTEERGWPGVSVVYRDGRYSLYCAVIVKQVDAKTRSKVGINELLRNV